MLRLLAIGVLLLLADACQKRKGRNDETRARPQCPNDQWQLISKFASCYYFGRLQLSWMHAYEWCQAQGADLAIVESAEENKFLYEQSSSLAQRQSTTLVNGQVLGPWIGLTKMGPDGAWAWVNKVGHEVHFENELAVFPPRGDKVKTYPMCAHYMGSGEPYKWEWTYCNSALYFICERKYHLDIRPGIFL